MAGIIEVKDQGKLRIYDADNSHYIDIVVPSSVTANRTITIPDASFTVPQADTNTVYTHPNHSGEVTSTADGATVIADNIVDEANLKVSNSAVNGYMLTAQSGNTGGLTWAEAGGGSFEKISTTTISSSVASVDFNTLSTDYRDFRIICSDLRIDTHQQFPILKVKRAGQGSFDGGSNEYIYANTGRNSQAGNITEDSTGANGLRFLPANLARDATVDGANMDVLIDCYNVHVTDSKFMIRANSTFIEGTYGRAAVGMTGGYRNALDAIIGIQIACEGSTEYISGTVTLYGRKI